MRLAKAVQSRTLRIIAHPAGPVLVDRAAGDMHAIPLERKDLGLGRVQYGFRGVVHIGCHSLLVLASLKCDARDRNPVSIQRRSFHGDAILTARQHFSERVQ